MNLSVSRYGLLAATALLLTATGCTTYLTPGAETGTVNPNELVFPDQSTAWQTSRKVYNQNDITQIKPGITKTDIYKILGTPHFREGLNAREWDYTLNYYDNNQDVKVGRYKIIFDGNGYAQEVYWQPVS
jgi:outer membrane protein assembly factor BamE (lipoprotein component of BamABCDE complex)